MTEPGICIPFKFENRIMVDGGLVDPVPLDVAREMGANIVIGVSSANIKSDIDPALNNVLSVLYRSIFIMNEELHRILSDKADIFIEPRYRGDVSYNMNKEKRMMLIKFGEEEAKRIIPSLKILINSY